MENLSFEGAGANPSFVRKRLIDYGAFGEVHEVTRTTRDTLANH